MTIKLDTIDKVRALNSIVRENNCDVLLSHDRYVVDASSLLGILTLNLSRDVTVDVVEKEDGAKDSLVRDMRNAGIVVTE